MVAPCNGRAVTLQKGGVVTAKVPFHRAVCVILPIVNEEAVRRVAVEVAGVQEGGDELRGGAVTVLPETRFGDGSVLVAADVAPRAVPSGELPEQLEMPEHLGRVD